MSRRLERGSILIIVASETLRRRLADALRERRFAVRAAGDLREALASLRAAAPELAVLDQRLVGRTGLLLLREIPGHGGTRVAALTRHRSLSEALEALRRAPGRDLTRGGNLDDVLRSLDYRAPADPASAIDETPSLARVERNHIERVLGACGGNLSEAARRLGIHRRSLQRKLFKRPPPR